MSAGVIGEQDEKVLFHSQSKEGESSQGFVDDLELNPDEEAEEELHQGLNARHVQLIALGGAIGTGLFVGSGASLHQCGPLGLLLGYLLLSTVIYNVMNQLGEMVVFLPKNGAVCDLARRYVDESLAFATGWIYYYTFWVLVCSEVTAAAIVIEYWTTSIQIAVWIVIFLVVIVALNFLAVQFYGETEFWFASIKILCICCLIMIGIVIFFGGGPNQHGIQGFKYWDNPGPFVNHLDVSNPNTGRFLDAWTAVIKSGFAFIVGPELVALTSAETQHPRRNVSKATRRFVYRLVFFYCVGALVIGVIVPSDDQNLLSGSDAAASPFVIGIRLVGISGLNHVINACILTSAWSAGNSFFYAATRFLYTMARDGDAPKIFMKVNRHGVPYIACGLTALLCCISFLNCSSSTSDVFTWFSNICTISGFIGWVIIGACYLRFRAAILFNNMADRVPFKTPFQPYGCYYSMTFITILCITNGYAVFFDFNIGDFIAAYITLPIFFLLYFGHKLWYRNWKWYYPVEEIDVFTGLEEVEKEQQDYQAYEKTLERTKWQKFVDWLL